MAEDINVDEWFKELERLDGKDKLNDEGFSSGELVRLSGFPERRVSRILREGVENGTLILGYRTVPLDWDGRRRTYRVYRIARKEDICS